MDPGMFRGEEDIDKEQIGIPPHAIERFVQRRYPRNWKELLKKYCLAYWAGELRNLLLNSNHKNAVSRNKRISAAINYEKEAYFFRNDRWQFIVCRDTENNDHFVLVTVLLLSQGQISATHNNS